MNGISALMKETPQSSSAPLFFQGWYVNIQGTHVAVNMISGGSIHTGFSLSSSKMRVLYPLPVASASAGHPGI